MVLRRDVEGVPGEALGKERRSSPRLQVATAKSHPQESP